MPEEQYWTALPVASVAVDASDGVTDLNPAAELLLNRSRKSAKGKHFPGFFADAPSVELSLQKVRSRRSLLSLDDVELSRSAAPTVEASLQIAPLGTRTGHLLACIRSRQVEERIDRGKRSELAARSAVGLAAMLSHEIRNPLAGIQGAAQLLAMHARGEDLELTQLIVDEIRRILKLLAQVDQFGSTKVLNVTELNVHDVLDRVCSVWKLGSPAEIRLVKEFDPSLPAILADQDKLMQVFLNLMKNASEALENVKGTITVRTCYDTHLRIGSERGRAIALPVQVEIIDNGVGIGPDLAPNVFEPFVSGRTNGSGLGLTLVSTILSEMGGWVNFESRPGRTVFRVSLPVAEQG